MLEGEQQQHGEDGGRHAPLVLHGQLRPGDAPAAGDHEGDHEDQGLGVGRGEHEELLQPVGNGPCRKGRMVSG